MLLAKKRIFIVEDNANNLAVISAHLRTNGASIYFERWGYETPTVIQRQLPIDLILLDLMFPNGVTGYDIFSKIRQTPELAHIPIVMITAADADENMPKARALGFAGYISKPISIFITRQLADVLEGKSVWIAESYR